MSLSADVGVRTSTVMAKAVEAGLGRKVEIATPKQVSAAGFGRGCQGLQVRCNVSSLCSRVARRQVDAGQE